MSRFQHEMLNQHLVRPIRLLTLHSLSPDGVIRCSVSIYELETAPHFHALSYMWGPSGEEKTILIDECPFRVRHNLWHFLRYLSSTKLRQLEQFQIWADAICIDQNNLLERNHQVGFMNHIYMTAASVITWLGPKFHATASSASGGRDVKPMIRWFASKNHPDHWRTLSVVVEDSQHHDNEWRTLNYLCANPYWSRTWIMQEILPARKITIIFEEEEFEWGILSYNFKLIHSLIGNLSNDAAAQLQESAPSLAFVAASPAAQIAIKRIEAQSHLCNVQTSCASTAAIGFAPLITLLKIFRSSQCEIVLDKVYALAGLSIDCGDLNVNYNISPERLFVEVLSHLALDLEKGDEESLLTLASALQLAPILQRKRISRIHERYAFDDQEQVMQSIADIEDVEHFPLSLAPKIHKYTCVGQIVDAFENHQSAKFEEAIGVGDPTYSTRNMIDPESQVHVPIGWTKQPPQSVQRDMVFEATPDSLSTARIDALLQTIGIADWGSIEQIVYARSFTEEQRPHTALVVLDGQITIARVWGDFRFADAVYSTLTSGVAIVIRINSDVWRIVGIALLLPEVAEKATRMRLRQMGKRMETSSNLEKPHLVLESPDQNFLSAPSPRTERRNLTSKMLRNSLRNNPLRERRQQKMKAHATSKQDPATKEIAKVDSENDLSYTVSYSDPDAAFYKWLTMAQPVGDFTPELYGALSKTEAIERGLYPPKITISKGTIRGSYGGYNEEDDDVLHPEHAVDVWDFDHSDDDD